mmetsp:Transcript_3091/g.6465  ORF Transcript_3091/g.6465 Transcript_3091/m.6465 type:complete len:273 (-) Transcript_3091:251-1069(-)
MAGFEVAWGTFSFAPSNCHSAQSSSTVGISAFRSRSPHPWFTVAFSSRNTIRVGTGANPGLSSPHMPVSLARESLPTMRRACLGIRPEERWMSRRATWWRSRERHIILRSKASFKTSLKYGISSPSTDISDGSGVLPASSTKASVSSMPRLCWGKCRSVAPLCSRATSWYRHQPLSCWNSSHSSGRRFPFARSVSLHHASSSRRTAGNLGTACREASMEKCFILSTSSPGLMYFRIPVPTSASTSSKSSKRSGSLYLRGNTSKSSDRLDPGW